jgi:hypothetical protein
MVPIRIPYYKAPAPLWDALMPERPSLPQISPTERWTGAKTGNMLGFIDEDQSILWFPSIYNAHLNRARSSIYSLQLLTFEANYSCDCLDGSSCDVACENNYMFGCQSGYSALQDGEILAQQSDENSQNTYTSFPISNNSVASLNSRTPGFFLLLNSEDDCESTDTFIQTLGANLGKDGNPMPFRLEDFPRRSATVAWAGMSDAVALADSGMVCTPIQDD